MNKADQATLAYNQKRMSFTELLEEASEIAETYEQDYENEITRFKYADDSICVFCGIDESITAYMNK